MKGLSNSREFRVSIRTDPPSEPSVMAAVVPLKTSMDFMIADGNPAEIRGINQVGLERRGFNGDEIRSLREAYRLLCRANLNVKQACETIRTELPPNDHLLHLLTFIEASKRGIVR